MNKKERELKEARKELEKSRAEDLANNIGVDPEGYGSYYPESERTKKLRKELGDNRP